MTEPYFPDINRAAVIVKLKKPFIDWLVYTSPVTDSNDAIKRLNICNGASKEHDGPWHELKPEDVQTEGFDSKHVYPVRERNSLTGFTLSRRMMRQRNTRNL